MTPGKENLAVALQRARESLESQIEAAVRAHQQAAHEALELDMDLQGEHSSNQGPPNLISTVRALVDGFHRQSAVQEAGVHISKVTAVDSDGDGKAAINVQYEYQR